MSDLREQLQAALGSTYGIERELGGGGMSRVFLARDNGLNRQVVVKVVPIDGGLAAVERFRREITTAAQLQHPHIVPVLSAGDADGVPYFTMPYVPGDSLRARMSGGARMPLSDAVKVLRDVAQALAFAHERGFVHRDIKPDNILLADGAAVVTDFGVAKALSFATGTSTGTTSEGMTAVGVSLGTPAYMAPEQVSADPGVDHRVDLYAWGCVAYELFTGASPFGSRSPAKLFVAHLTETPAPIAAARPDIPPLLAALVMRCLEKDPAHRPQSAREMLAALDALATPGTGSAPASLGTASSSRAATRALVGVALLAVVLGGVYVVRTWRSSSDAPVGTPASTTNGSAADTALLSSLAVLPFVNTSGDAKDEYFSDGLTDELTHALSKLPGLRLAGRSSSYSFKGKSILAPEVGKTLRVGAIIEGTVRRAGDRIRLTAQLISTRDGGVLWSDTFERSGADVFAVQDAFTSAIISALAPRLSGTGMVDAIGTSARGTTDAAAYDEYLKGRYYWAQRGAGPGDSSVKYLEQSVKRDASFARGWAGLALAHVIRPNYNRAVDFRISDARAEEAATRALALDSTLADAHAALGFLLLRRLDFAKAGAGMATARRFDPQSAIAAHWSAIYFSAAGDTAGTDRQMERALALDPLSPTTLNSHAIILFERRQFAKARERFAQVAEISRSFPNNSTLVLVWSGLADSAFHVAQRNLTTLSRGRLGNAVLAAAAAGRWPEARALRAQIIAGGVGITSYDRAQADLVFGNRAAAAAGFVDHLENDGGLPNIAFSMCFPPYDAIRSEPVWTAFLRRHQLRDCPRTSPWPIGTPRVPTAADR
ncbi:protein kinase [Gemmatimonas sp.]|uniref:protein kinase domain-containing protein n=1 Tax=Gemmatimonas sp. TaxID=1962908 RepID=UPI00286DDF47|nr:protein kinase [Gemmatimonas sp.]